VLGPYGAEFYTGPFASYLHPKPLRELEIAKALYLDGFLTLPEVEEKAKENKGNPEE
jgi:hypothetical protein